MLTKKEYSEAQAKATELYEKAGIVLSEEEKQNIEVVDFGLGELEKTGLCIVTYINTERCCAKELALLPNQVCPEHKHPPFGNYPGKEETFRVRYGRIILNISGNSIILKPGEQYTLPPNTLHWFQAGQDGAVVSEFSTQSFDDMDIFTNPHIERITKIT